MGRTVKLIVFCLLFAFGIGTGYPETTTPQKQRLTILKNKITYLKSKLTSEKKQKDQLNTELRNTEIKIGRINSELRTLEKRLRNQQQKLSILQHQTSDAQDHLEEQQQTIAKQIRIAYMMNRQNPIKLILNQQAPDKMSRSLIYFSYFNQQRQDLITELNHQIAELESEKHSIRKEKIQLNRLQQAQQDQQKNLKNSNHKREALIKKIDSHIQKHSSELTQLEEDKKQLEKIFAQIAKQSQPIHRQRSFRKMRQFLPWPMKGHVTHHFGTAIAHSDLSWNGILIKAPEGDPVHGIYPGKVAFADWLKGFGELVIIDHGGGFMTLYGRNRQIYKKVGDSVKANEIIAEAGNSGGFKESGLYFEIRYNGQPLNPEKWLKKHG